MPAKRKQRPKNLPETVLNRISTTRRVGPTPQSSAGDSVQNPPAPPAPAPGVLISDPAATAPESPDRPSRQPRAIVPATPAQMSEIHPDRPLPTSEEGGGPRSMTPAWWETELFAEGGATPPAPPESQHRGRVGVQVRGNQLQFWSDGADVLVDYDPMTGAALPSSPAEGGGNVDAQRLLHTALVCITCIGVLVLVGTFTSQSRYAPAPVFEENPNAKG